MKTVAISSAIVLSSLVLFILLWQFGLFQRQDSQIDIPQNALNPLKTSSGPLIWKSLWQDEVSSSRNKTNIGWIFTIERRLYDLEYRQLLFSRKWRTNAKYQKTNKDTGDRNIDGLREKRASSIVTYFCIFVLLLSLIRAALDMKSNLKKSREDDVGHAITLDSRRCSLNDFKMAQMQLKKKEQNIRRASLLRRAMAIMENPAQAAATPAPAVASPTPPPHQPPAPVVVISNTAAREQFVRELQKQSLTTKSMNNLEAVVREAVRVKGRERIEKQSSMGENSTSDSPTRIRPRFSSVSPTPPHIRRMSFPALRRGSSLDVVQQAEMDELMSHHSPEVKRRMRLLRH